MAKGPKIHHEGPGLKVLSTKRWYGGGYCGICGTRGDELVPRSVRYWDPDDGWRNGALCRYCGEEAASRGPQPDDYAYRNAERLETVGRIDMLERGGGAQ